MEDYGQTEDMLSTVGVYAPEKGRAQDMQEFYEMSKNDFLCVAGCLNAMFGNMPVNFVLEINGENAINQNGRKYIEFAAENESRITNTFFKHKDIHINSHEC